MRLFVNYEDKKIHFSVPNGWTLISGQENKPVLGVSSPIQELRRALDSPIGSPIIEEIASPDMNVVILFDDLQRPTPAHLALPEIMDRLNRAGVPDDQISAVCALGTHPVLTLEQLKSKVGEKAFFRLSERLFSHDSYASDNVPIGKTSRGTLIEINSHVATADLIIGVGECMPHPMSGFGGGFKILMPGVSSYRTVADHHFTWMCHRNSRVNLLDGNLFYEEIVDAGRLSKMTFKVDLVINEKKEVVRAFAGDPVSEHLEASRFAQSLYLMPLQGLADVTITSAFPLEIGVQATKALSMAGNCTRAGGAIIWIAPQKEAGGIMPLIREMASSESADDFHRRLASGDIPDHLREFGISYIMQIVRFKELAEKFQVFHVTEGLTQEQVMMMKYSYSPTVQMAIDRISEMMTNPNVAVFQSGGNVIPGVPKHI